MAEQHTPSAPTGTPIDFRPTHITQFFLASATPTGEPPALEIDSNDLVPLTSGGDGFSPTRTVNRTALHNLSDIVSVGALEGGDVTLTVYLPPSNAKMQLMRDSLKNGEYLIFYFGYADGTGVAGYCVVTGISPVTDPNAQFAQEVSLSTFNVNLVDAD